MAVSEKLVFLSPSDFKLGDVSFKPGLYQVQQLGEGPQYTVVFTRITGFAAECASPPWAEVMCGDDELDFD